MFCSYPASAEARSEGGQEGHGGQAMSWAVIDKAVELEQYTIQQYTLNLRNSVESW